MRYLYLYLCVLVLIPHQAYSIDLFSHKTSCRAVLQETRNRTPEELIHGLLPLKIAEEWRRILRVQFAEIVNRDLTDEQKIERCFESYYALRTSLLNRERRHQLDRLVEQSKSIEHARSTRFREGEILVHSAIARSSPVWLIFMVHELEHAVQFLYIPNFPYHSLHPNAYLNYVYTAERGAKTSEGLVLLALPEEIRGSIRGDLRRFKKFARYERKIMDQMLAVAEATVSVGAYIDHGTRYSKAECLLRQAYDNVPLALGISFILEGIQIAIGK